MMIDRAFILAAGKGTRMGLIGEKLPKVLWPVFEKNLLELQILRLLDLGIKKIFINLHHHAELIQKAIEETPVHRDNPGLINWLPEEELLGTGGGILNLKSIGQLKGKILVTVADQFYFFDKSYCVEAFKQLDTYQSVLFSCEVPISYGYNPIILDKDNNLEKIGDRDKVESDTLVTYSGVGFLNLDKVVDRPGPQAFFTTVAPYQERPVHFVDPNPQEYWDFGTIARYQDALFNFIKGEKSSEQFKDFLNNHQAIQSDKLQKALNSYGLTKDKEVINFSNYEVSAEAAKGVIVLDTDTPLSAQKSGLYYHQLYQN